VIVNLGVDDPESVPVRDAATVMLVRDGADGLEVFMLRRNLNSDFVGGAYVFPGGGVDPDDGTADVGSLCIGRDDARSSALLGVASGGLAFWVAAIRESFEEAGLLLAVDDSGEIVRFDDPVVNERFVEHRRAVDSGERSLVDVAREEGLRLATDRMHYFSRWITPLGAPRRYDTRFFIAHPPEWQEPVHDDREVIANLWIRPEVALERHAAGAYELIFPTVRSLEALCRFDTADDAVRHAAEIAHVEPILPTMVDGEHGLRILLPGDEIYDAITSKRLA
jgi:8-oxo-dGTP pyrophosphatase MutT (NUDIX family)